MGKPWYTDLMTYLIALAMGTMLCVTVFQLIPESLDLMAEKKYPIKCGDYRAVQKTLNYNHKSVIVNDCDKVCPDAHGGKAGGGIEGLEDGMEFVWKPNIIFFRILYSDNRWDSAIHSCCMRSVSMHDHFLRSPKGQLTKNPSTFTDFRRSSKFCRVDLFIFCRINCENYFCFISSLDDESQ